ncbi:hypothetical protein HK104_002394 [Borealophlyctis nickersoniae]|nr:hypothetical protein HK104_002394 [Borealophlyctis nickersoniae]
MFTVREGSVLFRRLSDLLFILALVLPLLFVLFIPPPSSQWEYVGVNAVVFFSLFLGANINMYYEISPELGLWSAVKGATKDTFGFFASISLGWVMIEASLWLGGMSNGDTQNLPVRIAGIAFASVGYPILKIGCIKAMEPAWRAWSWVDSEEKMTEAVRKDMALTLAYDCLFGVPGRIVVLRQPTFTSFVLSLLGSGMFELGMRLWEAIRFRRKAVNAVGTAADCEGKGGIQLNVVRTKVDVIKSTDRVDLEEGPQMPPLEPDFDKRKSALNLLGSINISPPLSKRVDVEPLAVTEGKRETSSEKARSQPLEYSANVESDNLSNNSKVVPCATQERAVQKEGAPNVMTIPLLVKIWGAHRIAETAADFIFRLAASFVLIFFVSLAPKPRHACFGYVDIPNLFQRMAVSAVFMLVFNVAGLAMEEYVTLVRYRDVMKWVPRLPWNAYGIVVMLTMAGGAGPMLAVDAGLFGMNDCLKNR